MRPSQCSSLGQTATDFFFRSMLTGCVMSRHAVMKMNGVFLVKRVKRRARGGRSQRRREDTAQADQRHGWTPRSMVSLDYPQQAPPPPRVESITS